MARELGERHVVQEVDDWTWKDAQVEHRKDETHNLTGANTTIKVVALIAEIDETVEIVVTVANIVVAVDVVVDVAVVVFVVGGMGIEIVDVEHIVVGVGPEKTAEIAAVNACS